MLAHDNHTTSGWILDLIRHDFLASIHAECEVGTKEHSLRYYLKDTTTTGFVPRRILHDLGWAVYFSRISSVVSSFDAAKPPFLMLHDIDNLPITTCSLEHLFHPFHLDFLSIIPNQHLIPIHFSPRFPIRPNISFSTAISCTSLIRSNPQRVASCRTSSIRCA